MKVGRQYLGKVVEIRWRDPGCYLRQEAHELRSGLAALALWKEYGVVDDVTDGVVRIVHSAGHDPNNVVTERADEY